MDKDLEKEYLEDLDHYDEGMGIHSTSYEKCKERLIRLAKIDNSKPSEALDKLLDRANHDEYLSRIGTEEAIKFLNENQMFVTSIKQALQRLESIDNAKPSEFKIVNYKGQYYLQINVNDDEATQIQLPLLEDEIKDVQLAINKFKQINQAKPSETLECLKNEYEVVE